MVWVNLGQRRQRGWGRGYGYGYGYPRRGYGGGGGCLRDLFFVEAGCCLAEMVGCGPQAVLMLPAMVQLTRDAGTRTAPLPESMVMLYRSRVSARRVRPCCRMTPSCSAYALEALQTHGTRRGLVLTVRRLLRCRPGGPRGLDAVPCRH